jgi:hypothetical protein
MVKGWSFDQIDTTIWNYFHQHWIRSVSFLFITYIKQCVFKAWKLKLPISISITCVTTDIKTGNDKLCISFLYFSFYSTNSKVVPNSFPALLILYSKCTVISLISSTPLYFTANWCYSLQIKSQTTTITTKCFPLYQKRLFLLKRIWLY